MLKKSVFVLSKVIILCNPLTLERLVTVDQSIKKLLWGVDRVITEEELKHKLIKSQKTSTPLKIKLGVDPTAPDIHLGHTVVLRKLRQFQDLGHEAILLIGGFTARIGDPSGKSKTRPPLSGDDIKRNADTYLEQVGKILRPDRLRVVDNQEWLDQIHLKDLIELLSYSTMSKLLEHNTFRDRFNQAASIRMHEFMYPFMQGYDSIHLQADVELGGSDQLFNIAFGRELQKDYGQDPQCALLMPILVGTEGSQKMSKSLDNYIGVTDSPQVMSQKLINMKDENIFSYLKLLSSFEPEEVMEAEKELGDLSNTKIVLEWKNKLVENILSIFHPGKSKDESELITIGKENTSDGSIRLAKLITLAGFAKSNREATTFIQSGAVKVNDQKVTERDCILNIQEAEVKLSVGKKKMARFHSN